MIISAGCAQPPVPRSVLEVPELASERSRARAQGSVLALERRRARAQPSASAGIRSASAAVLSASAAEREAVGGGTAVNGTVDEDLDCRGRVGGRRRGRCIIRPMPFIIEKTCEDRKSGAKKTSLLYVILCQKINFSSPAPLSPFVGFSDV